MAEHRCKQAERNLGQGRVAVRRCVKRRAVIWISVSVRVAARAEVQAKAKAIPAIARPIATVTIAAVAVGTIAAVAGMAVVAVTAVTVGKTSDVGWRGAVSRVPAMASDVTAMLCRTSRSRKSKDGDCTQNT